MSPRRVSLALGWLVLLAGLVGVGSMAWEAIRWGFFDGAELDGERGQPAARASRPRRSSAHRGQ